MSNSAFKKWHNKNTKNFDVTLMAERRWIWLAALREILKRKYRCESSESRLYGKNWVRVYFIDPDKIQAEINRVKKESV